MISPLSATSLKQARLHSFSSCNLVVVDGFFWWGLIIKHIWFFLCSVILSVAWRDDQKLDHKWQKGCWKFIQNIKFQAITQIKKNRLDPIVRDLVKNLLQEFHFIKNSYHYCVHEFLKMFIKPLRLMPNLILGNRNMKFVFVVVKFWQWGNSNNIQGWEG